MAEDLKPEGGLHVSALILKRTRREGCQLTQLLDASLELSAQFTREVVSELVRRQVGAGSLCERNDGPDIQPGRLESGERGVLPSPVNADDGFEESSVCRLTRLRIEASHGERSVECPAHLVLPLSMDVGQNHGDLASVECNPRRSNDWPVK